MDNENAAELYAGDESGEYKVEVIQDNTVYTKEADRHLPGLYYLVVWKDYPEEENTWEPFSAVMHLWKIISTFYKDYPEKPTATLPPLDTAPPMTRPTVKLPAKQKWGQPKGRITKCAKWGNKEEAIRRNSSQCDSRARSRRVARDLSSWRGECQGACIVVNYW